MIANSKTQIHHWQTDVDNLVNLYQKRLYLYNQLKPGDIIKGRCGNKYLILKKKKIIL